jgi:glyoxalase family protein
MPTFISARVYARLHNATMQLEGVHHVTLITGDAPRNVDFYTRVLGLRLVKKTVNQDDPSVYHLFYADEKGSAGSDITFFEYPGATRGKAGPGMVHTIAWRVGSEEALDFWEQRLNAEADNVVRSSDSLTFEDPEGVRHELRVVETPDEPLVAKHPEIPEEYALQGFDGVRAYAIDPERSTALLEDTLGFTARGDYTWEARGDKRGGWYAYDAAPEGRGIPGAGTVHHVAWATTIEEHDARDRPLLLQVDLLPRAERHPVRAGHSRARLRNRRGRRASRRAALAAAGLRTSPRADRAPADAAAEPARMTLEALERPAEGEPAGTLVLLHGRGADEHDLYPLLDALDPERRLRGLTPRGPLALPPGGRHWYRLGGIPTPEPETFWPSFTELAELLDGLQKPLVLGGFSQGAVMSYALALGRSPEKRPAALLPLSGFMPSVDGLELDLTGLEGFPVAIAHGTLDPVIPVEYSRAARDVLAAAGADVAYHESPLGHTIDPQIIPALRGFVAYAIGR